MLRYIALNAQKPNIRASGVYKVCELLAISADLKNVAKTEEITAVNCAGD